MTTATMNRKQQLKLDRVIEFATMRGHYEVKELKVTENEYGDDVHVQLEVGMPNDEGTMAELLCRSCYCFSIGPRGGMFVYNADRDYRQEYIEYYDIYDKADIYRR